MPMPLCAAADGAAKGRRRQTASEGAEKKLATRGGGRQLLWRLTWLALVVLVVACVASLPCESSAAQPAKTPTTRRAGGTRAGGTRAGSAGGTRGGGGGRRRGPGKDRFFFSKLFPPPGKRPAGKKPADPCLSFKRWQASNRVGTRTFSWWPEVAGKIKDFIKGPNSRCEDPAGDEPASEPPGGGQKPPDKSKPPPQPPPGGGHKPPDKSKPPPASGGGDAGSGSSSGGGGGGDANGGSGGGSPKPSKPSPAPAPDHDTNPAPAPGPSKGPPTDPCAPYKEFLAAKRNAKSGVDDIWSGIVDKIKDILKNPDVGGGEHVDCEGAGGSGSVGVPPPKPDSGAGAGSASGSVGQCGQVQKTRSAKSKLKFRSHTMRSKSNSTRRGGHHRIAGGYSARPGDFPPYVKLEIKNGFSMNLCGGTLISDQHVITAAHCFNGGYSGVDVIHTLRQHWSYGDPKANSRKVCVSPLFSQSSFNVAHDVAIIKLDQPFTLSASIQPACLPSRPIGGNEQAFAVGLGHQNQVALAQHLQVLPVKKGHCGFGFGGTDPTVICFQASSAQNEGDTCTGDSGGPILSMADGRLTVYGGVSYGPASCQAGPGGYTGAADFYAMRSHIQELLQQCA